MGSEETLAWFRHSEVKHGRVAMAAFVGWWAVGAGLRFPGELAHGLAFSSIPSKGLEAWDAVPGWGKAQLLLFAGLIEFHDEIFHTKRGEGGHYLRGGIPGKVRHILALSRFKLTNRDEVQYVDKLFFLLDFFQQNMVPGLYDPFGLSAKKSPEAKARGRDVEIKNGRLAMIGVAALWFEALIPGSVPLQPPC
jgi:hypothetical protein